MAKSTPAKAGKAKRKTPTGEGAIPGIPKLTGAEVKLPNVARIALNNIVGSVKTHAATITSPAVLGAMLKNLAAWATRYEQLCSAVPAVGQGIKTRGAAATG